MQILNHKQKKHQQKIKLREISPSDKPWDRHRANADLFALALGGFRPLFKSKLAKMRDCASYLRFKELEDGTLKLDEAWFCRERHCAICEWRRSMRHFARFMGRYEGLMAEHPGYKWLHLTLAVRNCSVDELNETIRHMNQSWSRLTRRASFQRAVAGWLRTTEVTRGRDGSTHPHFHVLLLVPPNYFETGTYIEHAEWVQLWQSVLRVDYRPTAHIQAVGGRGGDMEGALREVLKYATKQEDLLLETGDGGEWLAKFVFAMKGLRLIATGGSLGGILTPDEDVTEDEMLRPGGGDESDTATDDGVRVAFIWNRSAGFYCRAPHLDYLSRGHGFRRGGSSPPNRTVQGLRQQEPAPSRTK